MFNIFFIKFQKDFPLSCFLSSLSIDFILFLVPFQLPEVSEWMSGFPLF